MDSYLLMLIFLVGIVVFASIIIGMFLASVTTIKNLIESKLKIFGQKSDLKKSYKATGQLQEKVNKLEEEKSILKEQLKDSRTVQK
jgi:biopolymer transport protein ExbB/TolQ